MDPVRIIPVPKASFNKQRRISDLLEGQLQHFRHLEQKLNLGLDPSLARAAHTEDGCARYIAAMTQALRGQTAPAKGISLVPSAVPPAAAPVLEVAGILETVAAVEAATEAPPPPGKAKRPRQAKP